MTVNLKQFKKDVKAVLKANDYIVSINLHQVDNGTHAFVNNPHGVILSWCRGTMLLYAPKLFTYEIPYRSIEGYTLHETPELRGMTITLAGRQLLSIRERYEGGKK